MIKTDDIRPNKEQKEAIEHGGGPLLVIAGAGTGKTTVITERIKNLILSDLARPAEILALTFTEKAAREMEERVDRALPYGYVQMWISTFHSFCDRVLRSEALHIGLSPKYILMTEAETIRFLRTHLFGFKLRYFRPLGNPNKFLGGMLEHFSRLKDEDMASREYVEWTKELRNKKTEKQEVEKWMELAQAYQKYEELKTKEGVMDYSDLISNTLRLFRERPNVLKEYQERFKYILVDEYQDTNIAQNELVKLLAGKKANLTVVADDDQSVYRWRGASFSNVIQFRKSFPRAKIVVLTQNYRSTQEILNHAYKVIQNNNPDRLEVKEKISKKLVSTRKAKGSPPEFIYEDRVENEADAVAKKILQLVKEEERQFSDFAILVRANNHAEPFTRAFARAGVPYQFLGPGRLFRQPEVIELIAYLKVLYNFEDSAAFYKVVTMTHFNIEPRDLAAITNFARRKNLSLFEAAEKINDIFVSDKTKEIVTRLIVMIHRHLKLLPRETAGQITYYFLEDSGLLKAMVDPKTVQDEKRSQNIAKFFDKLKTYETEHEDASVFAVVDWIDLSMEVGESPLAADFDWTKENAVSVLTIHSAKGLEFPVVFVVNLVSQRFPTRERREQIPIPEELIKEILPEGDYHLEEERRLFYVAVTRAMDYLFLTAADYYGEGKRESKISPFVPEALGEEVISKKPDFVPLSGTSTGRQKVGNEQLSILDFTPLIEKKEEPFTSHLLPITYLSYSQIDTFRFCPLHYKLKYILNIPTPASAPQSFGNTLHTTLKEFCEALQRNKKVGEKELLALYEKNWVPDGYKDKQYKHQMKKRGEDYLLRYLGTELFRPDSPPRALETPFSFRLTPSLKIGGKIDRVDRTKNGIEIIDYKTTEFINKELPTQKDLLEDLQLSVYAMAANKTNDPLFPKDPEQITLSLYFFDKGEKVSTTRTVKQLEKAAEEILKVKKEIEESDFRCLGNFWCQDCEYKLFCSTNTQT
ncbi:MAG: UvrD-helicase domain-containing protein [Candidatus Blackburnbacteria bacterium]|nr:UvrD-helicase domain-containing protein [Candidatus Blackburnbacteria bacterium]